MSVEGEKRIAFFGTGVPNSYRGKARLKTMKIREQGNYVGYPQFKETRKN